MISMVQEPTNIILHCIGAMCGMVLSRRLVKIYYELIRTVYRQCIYYIWSCVMMGDII